MNVRAKATADERANIRNVYEKLILSATIPPRPAPSEPMPKYRTSIIPYIRPRLSSGEMVPVSVFISGWMAKYKGDIIIPNGIDHSPGRIASRMRTIVREARVYDR